MDFLSPYQGIKEVLGHRVCKFLLAVKINAKLMEEKQARAAQKEIKSERTSEIE